MPTLTQAQVAAVARRAGFSGDSLPIALAVARAESGWKSDALGDVGLQDSKWGPSVGLFQVRCLKAETGTGKTRDCTALRDPEHNARSAFAISGGGSNWQPWTVYKTGAYRQYLTAVQSVVTNVGSFIPPLARYFPVTTDYGAKVAAGPKKGTAHTAIDFGAPWGEPVFSMAAGRVLAPNANPEGVTGGNTVTIDYGNGIIATFAHLSSVLVKPGDRVASGQPIGAVGNTGITTGKGGTSGSHLHLDVWRSRTKINPLDLFDWGADEVDPTQYGSSFSVPSLVDWLTNSIREDEGKRTWGQYATGVNTDFVGAPVSATMLGQAVAKLGWQDKIISRGDLLEMAGALFEVGPTKNPLDVAADAIAGIGDVIAKIVNPETWARVFAMLLGFVMAAVGTYMVWSATTA